MLLLTAIGPLPQIKAAADEFDRHDPSPADAISWYEDGPSRFRLEVYVSTEQDGESARAIIGAAAPELHVNEERVDESTNWIARSLEGLPPVFAGRFVVAGAHVLGHVHGGRKRIWIEASEAFGTGHHGTTKGCLLALEDFLRKRQGRTAGVSPATHASRRDAGGPTFRALDVGAGSGVLAIATAKAGAKALAIEIDKRAAAMAVENVANNGVAPSVKVIAGDGARFIAGAKPFDLVFANILMRPLIKLSPLLTRATAPGGTLILSGLLATQAPLVRMAYESRGLVLKRRLRREAWATLVFARPPRNA